MAGPAGRGFFVSAVLAMLLAAGALALAPAPAMAQDRELRAMRERVEDLESQLRSITRYLSNNEDAPRDYQSAGNAGAGGETSGRLANVEVRIGELRNQLRSLTGQIEETQHQISQLNDRMDRMDRMAETPGQGATSYSPAAGAAVGAAIAQGDGQSGVEGGDIIPGPAEPLPTGEPTDVYNAALAKLRQDNFPAAAQGFNDFILQFPDNELTPNAQYWLGEAYYAQASYSEAARAFLTAYTKYPESSKASGALLKLGISLGQLDQKDDACAALREFGQKYPGASSIEINRAKVARQDLNCS